MVLEQLLQTGKQPSDSLSFSHVLAYPRPSHPSCSSSLLSPWICPGDSRDGSGGNREEGADWRPASLPIDSWALITESCIQQWCANQDLIWICKSQVELIAKAFKKQNCLLTCELKKVWYALPFEDKLGELWGSIHRMPSQMPVTHFEVYLKIPEANPGLYPGA